MKKIILKIKLYFLNDQFRTAKTLWYQSIGTDSEQAAYNIVLKYESEVEILKKLLN